MAVAIIALIYEIRETILAIFLALIIGASLVIVYNPDLITAKTLINEVSYISTLKSGKNMEITLDTEEIKNLEIKSSSNKNELTIDVDGENIKKEYISQKVEITQKSDQIIIS